MAKGGNTAGFKLAHFGLVLGFVVQLIYLTSYVTSIKATTEKNAELHQTTRIEIRREVDWLRAEIRELRKVIEQRK